MSRVGLVEELLLDGSTSGCDGGPDVVGEASLGTSVVLDDGVAEFIRVVSDTQVNGVILPIAIVDGLDVETRTIERQQLEAGDVGPAGNMLVGLRKWISMVHVALRARLT